MVFVSFAGLSLAVMAASSLPEDTGLPLDSSVPEISVVDIHGQGQTISTLSGEKGLVLVFFRSADWCRYCKKFEESLLPKSIVKEALSGYVKIRINPEHGDEDKALFDRWRGNGYPALFVQSNPDSPPRKARGPFTQKKLMSARDVAILFRPEIGVTVVPIN